MSNTLSDRMKFYEKVESGRRLMSLVPVMARLDGRSFHNFTKGLKRPFDEDFHELMVRTSKFLIKETNAKIAYTQSDEITLTWFSEDFQSQIWFDGRVQKMNSLLAATCSVIFNRLLPDFLPSHKSKIPVFDCRVWSVPNQREALASFIDRERDAFKNSVSMAAQSMFSHKKLMYKNTAEKQEMMFQSFGINFNDYSDAQKRGTYVQNRKVETKFLPEEIEKLPKNHMARTNPELLIVRNRIEVLKMPPISKLKNGVEVIFCGATPEVGT